MCNFSQYIFRQLNQDGKIQIADILQDSITDGPGLRTSIFVQGCMHHCPGCFNAQTWSFEGGQTMTIKEVIKQIVPDYGLALLGGDPIFQPLACMELAKYTHQNGHDVWCYTGAVFEEIKSGLYGPEAIELLKHVDVLVDGRFVMAKRDISDHNLYRGSTNQRCLKLQDGEFVELLYSNGTESIPLDSQKT